MLSTFFHAVFYNPIYNLLVALVAYLPGGNVGLAVIALTILIQLVLLPFSLSAARTQRATKALQPLYPFAPHPSAISLAFLGANLAGKSLILAALAGLTQYLQANVMLSGSAPATAGEGMQADFSRAMNLNMKYVFPIVFATISY